MKNRFGLEPDSRNALSFASWASKMLGDDSDSSSSSSNKSTREKKTRKKGKATKKVKPSQKAKGKTTAAKKSDDGDASNASDDPNDDTSCSMSEDESAAYVHELSRKADASITLKMEDHSKRIDTIGTKVQETQKSSTTLSKKFDSHVSTLVSHFSSLKNDIVAAIAGDRRVSFSFPAKNPTPSPPQTNAFGSKPPATSSIATRSRQPSRIGSIVLKQTTKAKGPRKTITGKVSVAANKK